MRSGSLGEYYQDCFIIECKVPMDFENIGNSDTADALGTFLHEYMHFLQNASTTYGNYRMGIFYCRMMNIFRQLELPERKTLQQIRVDNEGIEFAAQAVEIALGDTEAWTYEEYDFVQIEQVKYGPDETLGEYRNCALPTVSLLLVRNGRPEKRDLYFGAMCIMESMADLMERHIYGRSRAGEFIQYGICEKLWNYMLPDCDYAGWDKDLFLCLEYALMYENPGQMFYTFLNYSAGTGEVNSDIIISFFEEQISPNYVRTYENIYGQMIEKFEDIIPEGNRYCAALHDYVKGFYEQLYERRCENRHMFYEIYCMSPQESKAKIIRLMTETKAAPLIIDCNSELYSVEPYGDEKLGMEEYAALYALYSMAGISGRRDCFLKSVCRKYRPDWVDDFCDSEPLRHGKYEKLCTLGQLVYMWQCV